MYNNQLNMEQLFRNPKLKKVLPQFPRNIPLQNVYSGAEINRRAKQYIAGAIGGTLRGEDEITVRGKQKDVLSRVRQLQAIVESFFNSMPSLVKNLRNNTKVYTTLASTAQAESLKSGKFVDNKINLLQDVLDNINFNLDFNAMNSITNLSPREFSKQQAAWFKKVGINPQKLGRQ